MSILQAGSVRARNVLTYFGWSASDRSANTALSSSNNVVSASGGGGFTTRWARSATGKSTGKWRVQFVLDPHTGVSGTHAIGFATSAPTGSYVGATAGAWAYWGDYSGNGRLYNNNIFTQYAGFGMSTGQRFDLLIDLDAGRAWWRRNGIVISGNPVDGTGAMATFTPGLTLFLITDIFWSSGGTRLRTNPIDMVDAPVTGFTDGWPA